MNWTYWLRDFDVKEVFLDYFYTAWCFLLWTFALIGVADSIPLFPKDSNDNLMLTCLFFMFFAGGITLYIWDLKEANDLIKRIKILKTIGKIGEG